MTMTKKAILNSPEQLFEELKDHFPTLREPFIKTVIAEYQLANPSNSVVPGNFALYNAAEYQEIKNMLEELAPWIDGKRILAYRIIPNEK